MPYPEPIRRQVYDTYKCNVIYVVFSTILFSALTTQEKATPYMSCSPEIPLRIYDTKESYTPHVVFPDKKIRQEEVLLSHVLSFDPIILRSSLLQERQPLQRLLQGTQQPSAGAYPS